MFYCDACGKERWWPESFVKSRGPCEVCHKVADCNDIPSNYLTQIEPEPPDVKITSHVLDRQSDWRRKRS